MRSPVGFAMLNCVFDDHGLQAKLMDLVCNGNLGSFRGRRNGLIGRLIGRELGNRVWSFVGSSTGPVPGQCETTVATLVISPNRHARWTSGFSVVNSWLLVAAAGPGRPGTCRWHRCPFSASVRLDTPQGFTTK
jgi:hypothetical protein